MPAGLGRIIMRTLAKDPAQRYQSAGDLFDDLKRARHAAVLLGRLPSRLRSRPSLIVASVGGILVAGAALALVGRANGWWPSRTERSSVLVSHIANGTADPDFDGTLREAVTVYLSQSPYLDIVSDERVRSTLQLMGREPTERMTHNVAQELCQRLGLQAMLEGSVSAVGSATVVALAATDCTTGATIARQQVDVERKEDVLRAMGTITADVREALGESRDSLARHNVPIEEATTPSMDALKAYTEGIQRRAAGRETDAIPFFERAIALDPRFALAYTTLSSLYGGLGETGRSEELARLAYENREHVSERERLFITYQYHDRFTGDQTKSAGDARGLEAYLSSRLPAGERAGRAVQPPRGVPVGGGRSGGGDQAEPGARVSAVEPGVCAARRRQVRSRERRGGTGRGAQPRHRSAAPAPLSALRDAGRSADRACTARVGGDEQPRLRSHRRTRADRGVPRPHVRGAAAVRGDDRRGGRARASRRSVRAMPRRRR